MKHVTALARKRPPLRFFGTDCQIEKLAQSAIEQDRLQTENDLLREEVAMLRAHVRRVEARCIEAEAALAGEVTE